MLDACKLITLSIGKLAVEYGLMVALIAAVIVGVVGALGTQLKVIFNAVLTAIGGQAVQ